MADELEDVLGQPLPEDYSARVRSFIETGIPFNRFLGMRCTLLVRGRAGMEIPAQEELTGDPFRPALHGGVISTLADTVGGLAVFSMVDIKDRVSTIDLRVDYLRPARVNTALQAEAELIRLGNRVAVANVLLFQENDRRHLMAVAKGVYNLRRGAPGA